MGYHTNNEGITVNDQEIDEVKKEVYKQADAFFSEVERIHREKVLNELVKLNQEMGLYDNKPNPMIKE